MPKDDLGSMVGRQTPFLALIVPLILVAWSTAGAACARPGRPRWSAASRSRIGQFACSNYISVELTDIVASLRPPPRWSASCASGSPASRCRRADARPRPAIAGASAHDPALEREVRRARAATGRTRARESSSAYAPYLIIIVVFGSPRSAPIEHCARPRPRQEFAVARPARAQRQGRGAHGRRRSSSTGCRRPAR